MRLPMTAREQLQLAAERGHELSVVERTRPDFPDAPPKYFVTCKCGYAAAARRSRSAANSVMAWHLGQVIADGLEARRNGA